MVLNSRRCIADDVSSVSSHRSEYSSDAGYSSAASVADESSSQRSESAASSNPGGSTMTESPHSDKRSLKAVTTERPSSARPATRQRRTVEKGKRPSSAPFVAKSGSVNRSGTAVTLRITTNEQIRSKRRRQMLKQDVVRKKVAVARISFEWRCFWRGRIRRQQNAVTCLQRIARGRRARRAVLEELSAIAIQFHARRFLRRMAKIRAELLNLATLRLQRAFLSRQRRRCRVLQSLAADCAVAARERVSRLEQEKWQATQKRQRLAERKHAETVQAALAEEAEQKAARKAYGGKDHGKEELEALKEKLRKEEAAASLIRRVFLQRVMRRRVRALVHEQRQKKVTELATDVSNYIDAALIVARKAAGKPPRPRVRSAPPMPSVVSSDGGTNSFPSNHAHRRHGAHSAPLTREGMRRLAPLDSSHESIFRTQLRAAGQIYGASSAPDTLREGGLRMGCDHHRWPKNGAKDSGSVGPLGYSLDAAGRCVRAEVRLAARSLSAQEVSKEQQDRQRAYLSYGSDGTPARWLPRVNALPTTFRRNRRSSVAGGPQTANASRAGSRQRVRTSTRPHSAAY